VKPPVPHGTTTETPPWLQESRPVQQEVPSNKPWTDPAAPASAPTDEAQYGNKFVKLILLAYIHFPT